MGGRPAMVNDAPSRSFVSGRSSIAPTASTPSCGLDRLMKERRLFHVIRV
jgi:hypothetical protein